MKRGIPEEKLVVTGIPVAAACSEPWSVCEESAAADTHAHSIVRKRRSRAKNGTGNSGQVPVAGGKMRGGLIDRLIRVVRRIQREEHLILICGSNQKLEQRMQARFGRDVRVTILEASATCRFICVRAILSTQNPVDSLPRRLR